MASNETLRLWRLAQLDNRLAEIRKRAANLDVGQKLAAEVKAVEAKEAEVSGAFHALNGESKDLELANAGIADKLKRIDKELYGGIVSSREVETLNKEIAAQKRTRDANDERLLELMELIPPAEEAAKKWTRALDQRRKMLAARQVEAKAEQAALQTEYKETAAKRPELAKIVGPSLLARYESIRQKHGGIGMVEVNVKGNNSCAGCGTHLPERTIQGLKDDKTLACETCHRLLYYTEGAV